MSRYRKKSRKGKAFLTIIFLGVLVLLGADNFGFDWFNFKIDLNKSSNTTQSNTTSKDKDSKYFNIVIKDDKITLNDKSISMQDLESELSKLDSDKSIINLMDNGAYNETFTKIENYLNEGNFKVITSSVINNN
jgi:biopolymer transport protein ExbD